MPGPDVEERWMTDDALWERERAAAASARPGSAGMGTELCANCLHPVDRHHVGEMGDQACGVAIAVDYCDSAVSCPCEQCIRPGIRCRVDGCGGDAVHYRRSNDEKDVYEMCVEHFEEAEPYCLRYYELTGGRRIGPCTECSVGGCGEDAVDWCVGDDGQSMYDLCAAHYREAIPYTDRYYDMTGGRRGDLGGRRHIAPGAPCAVDGCRADASDYRIGDDGHTVYEMCSAHRAEAEPHTDRYYELTGGKSRSRPL